MFFAVLVGSLALAIGMAVFDLTLRELELSQTTTQSHLALYAADAGAECALYWDLKCVAGDDAFCGRSGGSAFATSSGAGAGPSPVPTALSCNSQDITAPVSSYAVTSATVGGVQQATTSFTLLFNQTGQQGKPYCANVTVSKWGNPSRTKVISRGYNTCVTGASLQLERSIQYLY